MESTEIFMRKITFGRVLSDIRKQFWGPFDYHRDAMTPTLCKIKKINWVSVDIEEYNKIIDRVNNTVDYTKLLGSTYCHRELDKCFPSSKECVECYRYHCFHCGTGVFSYYCSCGEFRCWSFIQQLPTSIYNTKNPKHLYYFKNENYLEDLEEKNLPRSRDTYGFNY
jgi:hypothetical protein